MEIEEKNQQMLREAVSIENECGTIEQECTVLKVLTFLVT
jgi:hypothetical protein